MQRTVIPLKFFALLLLSAGSVAAQSYDELAGSARRWIDSACPRSFSPSLWRSCVERNIAAIARPGFPDLSHLSQRNRRWVNSACPRSFSPSLWRSCVERNIAAIGPPRSQVVAPRSKRNDWQRQPKIPKGPAPDTTTYEIQKGLKTIGYDAGPVDGFYGNRTRSAIEAFQRARGIQVTGLVSQNLLISIKAEVQRRNRNHQTEIAKMKQPKLASAMVFKWPAWYAVSTKPPLRIITLKLNPAEVYASVKASIWVVVAGRRKIDHKFSRELSQGSAVAISSRRLLTNCHVVKGQSYIAILQGNVMLRAKVVSASPYSDRCVLEVAEPSLLPIKGVRLFAQLKIGERVFTVGAPKGLERTLGEGIISGLREVGKRRLVQTTAPISPGSSGGGLFDSSANLVGITTFLIREAQSINFAIAAEDFWRKNK